MTSAPFVFGYPWMEGLWDLIARLDDTALLRAFEPDALSDLLNRGQRRHLKRGEEVIRQGDDGDFLVVLLTGHLKIGLASANGRDIILGYAEPGDVLGEIAMLDDCPRTATVSASEPAEVVIVSRSDFRQAAMDRPESMWAMMRLMADRIRLLDQTVEGDRSFSMGPRLARVIVRLMPVEAAGDGALRLDLSQSDLGAFAGLSRENVNRQIGEWEAAGVLARAGRKLAILDPEYIRELAEFGDPE